MLTIIFLLKNSTTLGINFNTDKQPLACYVHLTGCVTAVQIIMYNFANYSPSIAMELKVCKEITCVNDKVRDSRPTNMSPEHYF